VQYGPDPSTKHITTYFRHAFSVTDPGLYQALTLRLLRDDGALVSMNGAEVLRSNLPTGPISATTVASTTVGGSDERTFYTTSLDPALLLPGPNVLAVEVHQAYASSTDIAFDLALTAADLAAVTRGPYLQQGTPTGVVVRWRTSRPTDSRVRYGLAPAALTEIAEDPTLTTEHAIPLAGLLPATPYFYSVGTTASPLAGGDANHFFVTAPAPGTAPSAPTAR
jgi:hypothetical protein